LELVVKYYGMKKEDLNNKAIFEEYPIGKSLRIMAGPAILGQLVTLIYNMADTFFIGQVNNPYMIAAASLVLPLFMMCVPLAVISGTGGGSLMSRLLGIGKADEAKRVSALSLLTSFVLGIVYASVITIFKEDILWYLGASVNNIEFAKEYTTYILCIGALPTIMSITFSNLLRSVGHSKEAGLGMTIGGVSNIILDPLFMFVVLPDGKEVIGAGIATMISNVISCIYYIFIIVRLGKDGPISLSLKTGLPAKENIKKVFTVGLPSATTTILFDTNNIILNRLMSDYGDIALAASGIVLKVERLSLNTNIGLCMGMAPIVAYNYSAKNYGRMKEVIKKTRRTGVIISLVALVLYEFFAGFIMELFIKDPGTVAYGTAFLKIRAFAAIVMFLSFYIVHIFQGVGSGKTTFWLAFIRYAFLNIPLLFILNHFYGMYGIMWGQFVGDVITASFSAIVLKKFLNQCYSE